MHIYKVHCKKRVLCYTPKGVSQVSYYTPPHSMTVFILTKITVFTVLYDTTPTVIFME